jgi:hypothetical protein
MVHLVKGRQKVDEPICACPPGDATAQIEAEWAKRAVQRGYKLHHFPLPHAVQWLKICF